MPSRTLSLLIASLLLALLGCGGQEAEEPAPGNPLPPFRGPAPPGATTTTAPIVVPMQPPITQACTVPCEAFLCQQDAQVFFLA